MSRSRFWSCLLAMIVWPAATLAQPTGPLQVPPPPNSKGADTPKSGQDVYLPPPSAMPEVRNAAKISAIYVGGNQPPQEGQNSTSQIPNPEPTQPQKSSVSKKTASISRGPQTTSVRVEWVGPKMIRVGKTTPYEIVVKNLTSSPVYNVSVEHLAPAGVQFFATKLRPVRANGKFTWNVGTLGANQEYRIPAKMLVSRHLQKAYSFRTSVTCTTVSEMRVKVYRPELKLAVTSPETATVGLPVPVKIAVANVGDGPTDAVQFVANLPQGFEHVRGPRVTINLGPMQANEKRTMQLVCTPRKAGKYTIDAQIRAGEDLRSKAATTTKVVSPNLQFVASGPTKQYIQRKATYTFRVTHPGGTPASGVVVQSELPKGLQFVRATDGGRYQSNRRTVFWYIGDMTPGQTREVKLEAMPSETGTLTQQAVVQTADGLSTKAKATTEIVGISALLVELTDVGDPVEVSKETVYEIRVTNTGSKTETNLTLVCTIPEGMEFRSADCAADVKYEHKGNQIIFAPVPRVAPRADVLYRVRVLGRTPGGKVFRAQIHATGLSRPVVDEESTTVFAEDLVP